LGTFWLKIEQFWPFEEISIFSNGGPPLLKIEISSNGQNCSILSQKVPKFEPYKHNDELFNIYYGFFMNFELLPSLTSFQQNLVEIGSVVSEEKIFF
jgi:hypothetical protein